MLFSLVILAGCDRAKRRLGSWPTKRRAAPSAPGVGLTRHPQTGAAEQPRLLYGNLLKIERLTASHFTQSAAQQLLVPVWKLVDFMGEFRARTSNQIHQH